MKNREKEYIEIIGKALRNLREEKTNKSLSLFANENDIPKSTLSHIELGQNQPGIVSLKKIATSFEISLPDLITLLEQNLPEGFRIFDDEHY